MFDSVYPDGDAAHALKGVSTFPVAPGQGALFAAVLPLPGKYSFVDHGMRNMGIGAIGVIEVVP